MSSSQASPVIAPDISGKNSSTESSSGFSPTGMLFVLAAWILWIVDPILLYFAGNDTPPLFKSGWSNIFGGLTLCFFAVRAIKLLPSLARKHVVLLLIQAFLFTACADFCYATAIQFINPGIVLTILRTQIALSIVAAMFLFGERLSWKSGVGVALILCSLGFILYDKIKNATPVVESSSVFLDWLRGIIPVKPSLFGWIMALFSTVCWAGGTLSSKELLKVVKPTDLAGFRLSIAGIALVLLSLATDGTQPYLDLSGKTWLVLAARGSITLAAAFVFYYYGLRRVPVYLASSVEPIAPIATILIMLALEPEKPITGMEWLGALLMMAGAAVVILTNWLESKNGIANSETRNAA